MVALHLNFYSSLKQYVRLMMMKDDEVFISNVDLQDPSSQTHTWGV